MGLIEVRFENGADRVDVSSYLPTDWLRMQGSLGFGVAPTRLDILEGVGGGGRHRSTRRLPRDIDLPIAIFGDDAPAIEAKFRKLVRTLNDKFSEPTMIIKYPTGVELSTPVHYSGGADPQFGVDSNQRTYLKFTMTLRSPDSYFTAIDSQEYAVAAANAGRGLIKTASLSKLKISSAQTIGAITVENSGDVEAYPVWTLRGPGVGFTATRRSDGASFSYDAAILNANPITVNAQDKTVTDSSGTNVYDNLGEAPKLFSIPPGTSIIDIVMSGSDSTSLVAFYFQPRYEVVFG